MCLLPPAHGISLDKLCGLFQIVLMPPLSAPWPVAHPSPAVGEEAAAGSFLCPRVNVLLRVLVQGVTELCAFLLLFINLICY